MRDVRRLFRRRGNYFSSSSTEFRWRMEVWRHGGLKRATAWALLSIQKMISSCCHSLGTESDNSEDVFPVQQLVRGSMAANQEKVWVGFDLGGTKMLTVAYDESWVELGRRRRKTRGRDGSDSGIERIGSTIERLLEESKIEVSRLAGIGIGCPGPIDLTNGRILTTPNLGWMTSTSAAT